MSWLFSQALVEASLGANFSDGAPFAPSSSHHTPQAYCSLDRMMAFYRLSRFGMTFEPSTGIPGEDVLTWCLAASRARTLASPVKVTASTESDPASGPKWRGSLAKYDPDSRSWKTAQRSLLGDSEEFSETWPRWGTTVAGELFPLPTLVPPIDANESGLWQTPVADDAVERKAGKWNSRGEPKLSAEVKLWPTPTVCGNYNRNGASATSGDGLATAVRMWPTPNAGSPKWGGTMQEWGGSQNWVRTENPELARGALNPTWVEWLMGWPLGWTDLKPLETDKSHSAPLTPGASSQLKETA